MTVFFISSWAVVIVIIVLVTLWGIKDYKKRFGGINSPTCSLTPEETARFMREAKENDKLGKGET